MADSYPILTMDATSRIEYTPPECRGIDVDQAPHNRAYAESCNTRGIERAHEIESAAPAGLKNTQRVNVGSKPVIPLAKVYMRS